MNTIKFVIVVSMVLLATDLLYYQVVNGLSDKERERYDKAFDNYIVQIDRINRQEACSILNQGLANYSLFDDNKRYSWNQKLDACQRPDGTIILNTTLKYHKETE